MPHLGIELRYLGRAVRSLVTIPTELFLLPTRQSYIFANFQLVQTSVITARIATGRQSNWPVYFLLLYRRRCVTVVLLCSPCRSVSNVTCEPYFMSDTMFTSNISSKVVCAFTVSNLSVYITV
jgi:hypothetical protein